MYVGISQQLCKGIGCHSTVFETIRYYFFFILKATIKTRFAKLQFERTLDATANPLPTRYYSTRILFYLWTNNWEEEEEEWELSRIK